MKNGGENKYVPPHMRNAQSNQTVSSNNERPTRRQADKPPRKKQDLEYLVSIYQHSDGTLNHQIRNLRVAFYVMHQSAFDLEKHRRLRNELKHCWDSFNRHNE